MSAHSTVQKNESTEGKKWCVAFYFALLFTILVAVYLYTITSDITMLQSWLLLFAVSFSAGSVSFYTGFPNMWHGYQKQIGVLGFYDTIS